MLSLPAALEVLKEIKVNDLREIASLKTIESLLPVVSYSMEYSMEYSIDDYDIITETIKNSKVVSYHFKFKDIVINFDAETFVMPQTKGKNSAIDINVMIEMSNTGFSFEWNVLRELITAVSFICDDMKFNDSVSYHSEEIIFYADRDMMSYVLSISSFNFNFDIWTMRQLIVELDLFFKSREMKKLFSDLRFYLGDL